MITSRMPLTIAAAAIVIAVSLTGCAASSAPAAPAETAAAAPSPSAAASSSSSGTSALNACMIVTEALITQSLGIDPGAGVASGDDVCNFKTADGSVLIVAQTSPQAELYYPTSIYDASAVEGATPITSGVDRGYYQAPTNGTGNSGILVVKSNKAVFLTMYLNGSYTGDGVLALATAIAAKL
jgi:hypothetical protein